jgi:uncharacterized protein (DUF1501 family)
MKRKVFIGKVTAAAGLLPLANFLSSCRSNTHTASRKIFVFVQLVGGNDGLNTLIPVDQYPHLTKARANLIIPEKKLLPINGTSVNGLHPSMKGIQEMYNAGLFSFIQNVGYENQNYSHFRSQDIWLSGSDATTALTTGWMARAMREEFKNYPVDFPSVERPDPPALKIGEMGTFLFQGDAMDLSIVVDNRNSFESGNTDYHASTPGGLAQKELENIRNIYLQSEKYATRINEALQVPFQHSKLYPETGKNPLADQLKHVVKLINGGLQTSFYHVDLKGFDTHSAQVDSSDTTKGNHADLLAKLSNALTCFWEDVVKMNLQQEVTGMIFSEFGRRIVSNAAYGTDHGAAQPVMFFGAGINPGIIGKNPVIPAKPTSSDNLPYKYDFRSIYAAVLSQLLKQDTSNISQTLMGNFIPPAIFKS